MPIKVEKDKICTLTNETIKNAKVYNYENGKETKIYDLEKINSNDKYDIYLSGSTPLITITNENAKTDKELIVCFLASNECLLYSNLLVLNSQIY